MYNNVRVTTIREEIEKWIEKRLKKNRNLLVLGNWNTRIGEEQARTETQEEDEWRRLSEDTLNVEGKRILGFYVEYDLTILNGRMNDLNAEEYLFGTKLHDCEGGR